MPLYEFECSDCHATFERIVRSTDDAAQVRCNACQGQNVKRLISAGSHRLGQSRQASPTCSTQGCRAGSPFR